MGFLMQNMGNDPTSQLYISKFSGTSMDIYDKIGGEWLESPIIYLLSLILPNLSTGIFFFLYTKKFI